MTKIVDVLAVPAVGGCYTEDITAIQAKAIPLQDRYTAAPITPGFRKVREVAEALSVGLVIQAPNGSTQVAWGDCVAVAYSGKAGRDPVFRAGQGMALIQQAVAPALKGRTITAFRPLAEEIEPLIESIAVKQPESDLKPDTEPGSNLSRRDLLTEPAGLMRSLRAEIEKSLSPEPEPPPKQVRPSYTALRYGVSQALLQAAALSRGLTMAEVITEEWDLPLPQEPVPVHAQSGGERYNNADKMIVRRVDSLPHGLIDDIPEQLGRDGNKLTQYIRWLKERIRELSGPVYRPVIHLDVHGALGTIFENQPGQILGQLFALENAAKPYSLRIESPVIMDSRDAQIKMMQTLREYVRARKMTIQLVADEWANTLGDIWAFIAADAADMIQIKMPDLGSIHNTIEAVLACKDGGIGAFLGGSCTETDISARISTHVALATRPDLIMAKPGMGVDEAIMLMNNEMVRTLAWISARKID